MDGRHEEQGATRAATAAGWIHSWLRQFAVILVALGPGMLRGQEPVLAEGARIGVQRRVVGIQTQKIGIPSDGVLFFIERMAIQSDADDEALAADGLRAGRHLSVVHRIRVPDASLQDFVFGSAGTSATVRNHLDILLRRRITAATAAYGLTDADAKKLNLAGRGDIKRLYDRFEALRAASQEPHPTAEADERADMQRAVELSRSAQPLRKTFESGPFDDGSLFAKTLAKTVSPGRIAANPVRVQVLSPRLEAILGNWEQAASRIQRFDCDFTQFTYDPNREVERRGTGSFACDGTGRAAFWLGPAEITPGEASTRMGMAGKRYALRADEHDRWHWARSSAVRLNEVERTYSEWSHSEDGAPASAAELSNPTVGCGFVLPFLLGLPADVVAQKYDVSLVMDNVPEVRLKFKPNEPRELAVLREAVLILTDGPNYRPAALQLISASGVNRVLVFNNTIVNRKNVANAPKLDYPDLKGYRKIVHSQSPDP